MTLEYGIQTEVAEVIVKAAFNRTLWLRLLIFVVDCLTPANLIVPFLYIVIPFAFRGREVDRRNLWIMAVASVALTLFAPMIGYPTLGAPPWIMWTNRVIVSACILIVTYFCDQQQQAESRYILMLRQHLNLLPCAAHFSTLGSSVHLVVENGALQRH